MIPRANLFSLVRAELCPSVGDLLSRVMGGACPLRTESVLGEYGGTQVNVQRGEGRLTYVSLATDQRILIFRQSRHVPGAVIMERREFGGSPGMIQAMASMVADQCGGEFLDVFSIMMSLGDSSCGDVPHLFLTPCHKDRQCRDRLDGTLTGDPGEREVDFVTALDLMETRFHLIGTICGPAASLDVDEAAARYVLGPVGLGETDEIMIEGYILSSLVALAGGLRFVFRSSDDTVLRTFPDRNLPPDPLLALLQ